MRGDDKVAEYIKREVLLVDLFEELDYESPMFSSLENKLFNKGMRCAIINVKNQPKVDVEEVRHGEWIHTDQAEYWTSKDECSECHYHTRDRSDLSFFNYCPNCGAKMDLMDIR